MKTTEITKRIEKLEVMNEKKQALIEKNAIRKAKVLEEAEKYGFNEEQLEKFWFNTEICEEMGRENAIKVNGLQSKHYDLEQSTENAQRTIADNHRKIAKYQEQLLKATETENEEKKLFEAFDEHTLKAMQELQNDLVKIWNEWDIEHRNDKYAVWKSDKEIDRSNKVKAKIAITDLMSRVYEITGSVLEAHLHTKYGYLNGTVKGVKGTAKVETIGAGGYNIVRFHFRTLVNKI